MLCCVHWEPNQGAFYDAGYWHKGVNANEVFKNLSKYYASHKIPVKYIQVGQNCCISLHQSTSLTELAAAG